MAPADKIIFAVGVFATLLLSGGVLFTILEFRKMGQHAERFRPNLGLSGITGEKPSDTKAVNKK
jgi:hypothetical protein